ncbi:hypothetical protein R69608_05532 [Paraburkholderia nemoris]|uniref:hypothetical protein n=1 Tax=Paraburkholderia nemoris TaxID=2793076 RepID=UPI00191298CE|nr:hypothetical protein [Paraburkholderia nemoris]MBK5150551.1 hypothetical protein [Burkholderia sp. R-69608]CAE6946156.1 hypothetical protein R69608_05532 [Paraburkholderia nemoris]
MEGIRRIGVVIKALSVIWLLGFLAGAAANMIGDEVQMSPEQMRAAYEAGTGKNLEAVAQATLSNGKDTGNAPRVAAAQAPSLAQQIESDAAVGEIEDRILTQYFAGRPTTIRKRNWDAAELCAVVGLIGGAVLGALGWIIAGFAVKRGTP